MRDGVVHGRAHVDAEPGVHLRTHEQVAQALQVQAHLGAVVRLVRHAEHALAVAKDVAELGPLVDAGAVLAAERKGAQPVSLGAVVQRRAQVRKRLMRRHGDLERTRRLGQAEGRHIFREQRPLWQQ